MAALKKTGHSDADVRLHIAHAILVVQHRQYNFLAIVFDLVVQLVLRLLIVAIDF